MTIEFLQSEVERFKQETDRLREINPEIEEIRWNVKEIPYGVFEEYLRLENESRKKYETEKQMNHAGGHLFYLTIFDNRCQVIFWSKKVKTKTTIQVLEELEEVA